jgi:radical SAM protein with 4Fe4S-binding SPASM domain
MSIIDKYLYKLTRKCNRKINSFFRQKKITFPTIYPSQLFIEPTNICNAKCPLCPTGTGKLKRGKGMMTFAIFKKIIDQSKPFIDIVCLWNMGEPFLNKDIFKMIKYANKHGIYTISSTNGYVFYQKKDVLKLLKSGLDQLYVGMDGIDQKTFSKYRKNVDLNKILNGLEILKEEKKKHKIKTPEILYQFIPMKHNENQLEKAREMSEKLDTTFVLKYASLEMVNKKDKTKFLPSSEKLRIYKENKNNTLTINKQKKCQSCVLWDALLINWDGSVNPCIFDYYSKIVIGNINHESIKQIWKSKKLYQMRCKILEDRSKINICQKCPIQNDYSEEFKN